MRREYSKAVSLGIITVVYVIAAAAGILAFGKLGAALGETWALLSPTNPPTPPTVPGPAS